MFCGLCFLSSFVVIGVVLLSTPWNSGVFCFVLFCFLAQFGASRRGKKMLNSSRDINEVTYHSGEGAGGPAT